jgi:hypothetical protein
MTTTRLVVGALFIASAPLTAKSTEAHDEIGATQLAILDSPGIGFRSTAQMTAAREFLLVAEKAYALRRARMKDSNGR